ncbi:unnamed protein product [Prunus armeniaca]
MEEGSPGVFLKNYRLTKQVRASNDSEHDTDLVGESDPIPMMSTDAGEGSDQVPHSDFGVASFRDKLMNKVNMNQNVGIDIDSLDADYEDLNDADDVVISRGERDPSIQFSDRAMDRFCKPWQNALIFELEEDLNFVLIGGPWIIAGQYLVMQKWRSGFCPATAHVTRMAAWIRVSAIQLECFDNWYNIEHEGLPDICYLCGMYGHKREHCSLKEQRVEALGEEHPVVGGQANLGFGFMEPIQGDTDLEQSLRGPWMNVAPRRRPKADVKSDGRRESGAKSKGSRFDTLRTGNKTWTKSKNTKYGGTRHALNDISNKTTKDINASDGSVLMASLPSQAKYGSFHSARTKIVDGKKVVAMTPVSEQLDSWGHGQHIQKDTGVYIFGHQPPNIEPLDVKIQKGSNFESVDAILHSDDDDSGNQFEKMDLSEGHMDSIGGQVTRDAFNIVEGMASDMVKREKLWEYLTFVAESHELPWLLAGDFNDILSIDVKLGGAFSGRSIGFKDWFDNQEMLDLGFARPKFTWTNKRVLERLDKAICNVKWRRLFSNANDGDRNTKFFHLTTVVRKRRNKIERLKDSNGDWVEDDEGIKRLGLYKCVDLFEVRESLFGIGSLKALWADGFPACFYQSQWHICGPAIFNMVQQVFIDCQILDKLNATLITLVPKVANPQTMIQFRPISLCSTLYKEQMHNFKNSKGKKGFITWKIDLSKAYDRLNWNFIEHVLVELRLPVDLVRLIKSCVTIVVNFEKSAIYCSPNTCKELAKEISYICGSPLTNNLGKYLGMPLLHSRVTKATYESLVDKVKHRLASWKGLSKAAPVLGEVFFMGLPCYLKDCVVSDFSKNGWWDVNKLRYALHDDLVQKILNVPVGFMGSIPDSHIWRPSPNGVF